MAKKFTQGKGERLKSRKVIEELFNTGNSFIVSPFRIINTVTESGLRIGVGVSTKNFKKATDRNRIKRLIREAWRVQKLPLREKLQVQNSGLAVFLTYTLKEMPDQASIADSMQKVVKRLLNKINETGTSTT